MDKQETELFEVAAAIKSRRLEMPAIFFLEMHKPLSTVCHTALCAAQPLLNMLVGSALVTKLLHILESRERVEALIVSLEKREESCGRV